MDTLDRDEQFDLLAEALMRDATFRPRRPHRAADADRYRLEARICSAGIADRLYRCAIRWSRLPPVKPHKTV